MRGTWKVLLVVIAGLAELAAPLQAQDTTAVIAAPEVPNPITSPLDTLPVAELIAPRAVDRVRQDLAQARSDERNAGERVESAKREHRRAGVEIDIVKRDIDALKPRIELAKNGGQAGEQASLEERKRQMEAQVRAMEKVRQVGDDERKLAEAQREHARARIGALEAEQRLADQRLRLTGLGQHPLASPDYSKAANRLLELQKTAASKGRTVAAAREAVADRRQKAFEEQSKWLTTVTGVKLD